MSEIENEKYKDLSREDLLRVIEKLDSRKKYGLIWDEEKVKEQFEKDAVNALPILKEIKGKEIATSPDEPINILIEGDNYHALSVLNFTHQGKVDVIYIDPPYNTGNNDFSYNDNYVDREDAFRHSKWLSFMNKRLKLAKNLLKDDGTIFMSIDDNEFAQLKLLCDEIFGEKNFIIDAIWNSRKSVSSDAIVSLNHNHTFIYAKDIEVVRDAVRKSNKFKLPAQEEKFSNFDNDKRGAWTADPFEAAGVRKNLSYAIKNPKTSEIYYPTKGRHWAVLEEEYFRLLKDDKIVFGKNGKGKPSRKRFLSDAMEKGMTPKSIWDDVGTTTNGTKELELILGEKKFTNPKPVSLIKKILSLSTDKNSIVLDFMAGSGTTGHAVLECNKEDGGRRQFILCTNNELNGIGTVLAQENPNVNIEKFGICERATFPRIKNIIQGYKNSKGEKTDGLGSNLKYFKTGFVKKTINRDDMKIKLTRECTEMLCIREGVFDEKKKTDDYAIFEQKGRIMAVYYSIERKGLKELKKELDKMKGEKVLYCFTLDPLGLDKSDFTSWKDTQLEPIPQKILEVYEEIYEY
jgi:adenine-specific DNA-methyltransferase